MKIAKHLIIVLISIKTFGQTKPIVFYNENKEEITKESFFKLKDYTKNLDLYFENDSLQYGLLIKRQQFGKLDQKTFTKLKSYLTEISHKQIDSTQNIVINYLTAFPTKEKEFGFKASWNILDKDYLKKLHEIANVTQFWINSPKCDNLKYYQRNKIKWISDKENLFNEIFFPYQVKSGNYILIKPNGKFYSYLGEHGKYEIWENVKKYFK